MNMNSKHHRLSDSLDHLNATSPSPKLKQPSTRRNCLVKDSLDQLSKSHSPNTGIKQDNRTNVNCYDSLSHFSTSSPCPRRSNKVPRHDSPNKLLVSKLPDEKNREFQDNSSVSSCSLGSYASSNISFSRLSLSSSVSLPSFIPDSMLVNSYFNEVDFAGSVPLSHGGKASLFGSDLPAYRRFNVLGSPRESSMLKEDEEVEKKDSSEDGNKVDQYCSDDDDYDDVRLERKKTTVDTFKSMLGEGFRFDKKKNFVYVPKRKSTLVACKKISKHSTTLRKFKPERNASTKKKVKEYTKIPGPLPRVYQRAKIKREMAEIVTSLKVNKVDKDTGERLPLKKLNISLKSAVRDVITAMQDNSVAYWDKYVGQSARADFYKKYKEAGRLQLSTLDTSQQDTTKSSPRTKYMKKVVKDKIMPLPILLRKESEPKGIFLAHKGLGDSKILPVIHVLEDLPTVESIDLSDNRLTDESLMPLALKLTKLENLTSLNLSDNKIDDSSQVIMDYLRNKKCKLTVLCLDAADVDDNECGNLARAIMENESIETLSLRNNLIGKDELLNVVYPDFETGGEALGEMLCHNETLTELDVSWNFIRLDSAIQFADSLLLNTTLVTLKLAYNAFGDLPTQFLGKALKENNTLKFLDVQYNSITPRAATVLANALLHNDTIETLILDGNVLGDVGSQAVVAAIQRSSNESRNLNISFAGCDCKRLCPDVFNAANPSGSYTLDMSEPYGQMVCEEIMYLANYRAGCALNSVQHRPKGESRFTTVELIRPTPKTAVFQRKCIATQKEFAKEILRVLDMKRVMANSTTQGVSRHRQHAFLHKDSKDDDSEFVWRPNTGDDSRSQQNSREGSSKGQRSGSRDSNRPFSRGESFNRFTATPRDSSRPTSRKRRGGGEEDESIPAEKDLETSIAKATALCKTILEQFDLFPDDSVHYDIVNELITEAEQRLMVATNITEFKEDFTFSVLYHIFFAIFELNDADHSGDMDLEEFLNCISCLGVQFDAKYAKKLLRDFDVDKSGYIDNQEFAMIMVNEFCRLDVARDELLDASTNQPWVIPSSGQVIMKVHYQCELPSIYDVSHDEGILGVIKSIREVATDEQRDIIFANATTSPYFFMSAQQALMLFEEMGKHDESRLDVISRVLPQLVSPEQCHRFVDSVLSPEGKFALRVKMGQSYNVFMGLYSGHYTYDLKHVQKQQEGRALSAVWTEELLYMKKHRCDTSQRGNYSNFRNETYAGIPTAITSTWFASCPTSGKLRLDYVSTIRPKQGNWPLSKKRFQSLKDMLGLESIMEIYDSKDYSRATNGNMLETSSHKKNAEEEEGDSALTLGAIKEFYLEYMESCHHYHSIYPEERQRDVSRADYDPNVRPPTPDNLRDTDKKPSLSKYHKIFPYAYMKLLKLQLALPSMFLSIDQVIEIIQMFPPVNYLRVQAFVSMFSRIVDYDKNGVRILDILSRDDQSELLHRVGILNLIDPIAPDRRYRLDLRRWDHREACKIMIQLAIVEPGENWLEEEYRWSKYDANVPGWSLPMQWTQPDESNYGDGGPRRHGWCSFIYTSTEPGCAPNWALRRELRKRVLCGIKRNA